MLSFSELQSFLMVNLRSHKANNKILTVHQITPDIDEGPFSKSHSEWGATELSLVTPATATANVN